ncbi:hypothetical protein HK098_000700 [Nowakowskiella sp. JEL0407]|nr:hypothetical protein HK098_000700 [Nowakowskiella sp. JEL0407]
MKFLSDLKDSNIAGLGTDLEKKVRLEAAQTEEAWSGVGTKVELRVFRIEQFKVKAWPEAQYGSFYSGDSYIVINTWKKPDEDKLYHDIHFWLGEETTQDEAGTAAYKTVELDDYLGTIPVQYREVQGSESEKFLSYFKKFNVMAGGVATGFKHVKPEDYVHRLLRISNNKSIPGGKGLIIREVPLSSKSLNEGDVFVLDAGLQIIQWNGSKASGIEKVKAAEFVRSLDDDRKGATVTVFEQTDSDAKAFWDGIGGKGPIKTVAEAEKEDAFPTVEKQLWRLSNKSATFDFKQEGTGTISKSMLDSNDVFVFDAGNQVFVWVGSKSSKDERVRALQTAVEYLAKNQRPLNLPIVRVVEGSEPKEFLAALA